MNAKQFPLARASVLAASVACAATMFASQVSFGQTAPTPATDPGTAAAAHHQRMSLQQRLADLEAVDLGSITAGCALAYLDLRFPNTFDWRARAPGLAAWYADFAKRPSMQKTRADV